MEKIHFTSKESLVSFHTKAAPSRDKISCGARGKCWYYIFHVQQSRQVNTETFLFFIVIFTTTYDPMVVYSVAEGGSMMKERDFDAGKNRKINKKIKYPTLF